MDITAYSIGEFDSAQPGMITFQGKQYTPEQVEDFAYELIRLTEQAEVFLPEEETRAHKEMIAAQERQAYDTYRRHWETTPISNFMDVWVSEQSSPGYNPDGDDMWRAQDGDKRTRVRAAMREYEAEHTLST